jgi:hypothetical protein
MYGMSKPTSLIEQQFYIHSQSYTEYNLITLRLRKSSKSELELKNERENLILTSSLVHSNSRVSRLY